MNEPKLCPAAPLHLIVIVSSGNPSEPFTLVISDPRIVPSVLSVLVISISKFAFSFFSIASLN